MAVERAYQSICVSARIPCEGSRRTRAQNFCATFVKLKPVVFVDGVQSFVEQVFKLLAGQRN